MEQTIFKLTQKFEDFNKKNKQFLNHIKKDEFDANNNTTNITLFSTGLFYIFIFTI